MILISQRILEKMVITSDNIVHHKKQIHHFLDHHIEVRQNHELQDYGMTAAYAPENARRHGAAVGALGMPDINTHQTSTQFKV
jgi:hypothetical protein